MGLRLFGSSYGNYTPPNPNPLNWLVLKTYLAKNAYVLMLKYPGCTTFEGKKILVYRGRYDPYEKNRDPHFFNSPNSPIARFRPDDLGWSLACSLAKAFDD